MKALSCFLLLAGSSASIFAQSYSLAWYKVSGGGGASANGGFSLSGSIGQPDASGAMTGGQYSLKSGFWSLISGVQTVGLPNLVITHSGNSVIVSWPDAGNYTLQQNASPSTPGAWSTTAYPVSTVNGTNRVTITSPTGYLFFRLKSL